MTTPAAPTAAPEAPKARFLMKNNGDPHVYPYTERLAARPDMIECDAQGNAVKTGPRPAVSPFKPRPINPDAKPTASGVGDPGAPLQPARPPTAAAPAGRVDTDEEAPVDPAVAEQQEARKAQLIKFAKDRFGKDLDPEDTLAVIEKRVAKLLKVKTTEEIDANLE